MNQEKCKRLARDLASMTMPEAMLVIGTLMRDYSVTVAEATVAMLQSAAADQEGSMGAASGDLYLMEVKRDYKIQVIKTIRKHCALGLKEAKELSERWPVELCRATTGKRFTTREKLLFAQDLREHGAVVEFRG